MIINMKDFNEFINNSKLPFKTYYSYNPYIKTYKDIGLYFKNPIIYNKLFNNSNENITVEHILWFIKDYYKDFITYIKINNENSFQVHILDDKYALENWKKIINKLGWNIVLETKNNVNFQLDIEK